MSMSMPITYNTQKESDHMENLPMLIPRILMSVNHKHIPSFTVKSVSSICKEYGISDNHKTIVQIKSLTEDRNMPVSNFLGLFFLLLNIDTELKDRMMKSETEVQKRKLGNFFMNLHKHLVPEFLAKDDYNVINFVTKCSDAWSVA